MGNRFAAPRGIYLRRHPETAFPGHVLVLLFRPDETLLETLMRIEERYHVTFHHVYFSDANGQPDWGNEILNLSLRTSFFYKENRSSYERPIWFTGTTTAMLVAVGGTGRSSTASLSGSNGNGGGGAGGDSSAGAAGAAGGAAGADAAAGSPALVH